MNINSKDTAVLVIDPQNDFLSEEGATWALVGDSVTENNTIDNIEQLFKTAKQIGYEVFISPHYYYPTDHKWNFVGSVEKIMHEINMFGRKGALDLAGFTDSGADWLERFKPYIEDGKTVVTSPHKVYGPENNDLVLQLRKRHINKVILIYANCSSRDLKSPWSGMVLPVRATRNWGTAMKRLSSTSVTWPMP
jgi:nicotinamidase-related amidase